ncbi:glycosyltransferase 87 family protein [Albimonas sp. CAU 1670]|uniref:glycosyltransferase 87 family protein n=1 Tax=Albimonas sp. CAU 1670 TaxID=3032599 RepID=UPI0023DC2CD2|nr:glycosyltransferase 87 family protein [Albimonas sp. CAU 1670]MDF2231664.1 glycosyltransferase 87 family protein [Albimonas sp. CAU 1670]
MFNKAILAPRAFEAMPIDTRYIWLAGQMWRDGLNPYDHDALSTFGIAQMPGTPTIFVWSYSPHFWPVARFLAEFDHGTAPVVWGLISMIAGLAGMWVCAKLMLSVKGAWGGALAPAAAFCFATSHSASSCLYMGQFAMPLALGAGLFALALVSGARWMMIAALVLLTLKANFALPFLAVAVVLPEWRRCLMAAGALAFALAAPALIASGPIETIEGFLDGASRYGEHATNNPRDMTGAIHLAARLGVENPQMQLLSLPFVAMALAAICAWSIRQADQGGADRTASGQALGAATIAIALGVTPLHAYDLVAWPLVLVIAASAMTTWRSIGERRQFQGAGSILIASGLLISGFVLIRPNIVADVLFGDGATVRGANLLASLALAAMLTAALAQLVRLHGRQGNRSAAAA